MLIEQRRTHSSTCELREGLLTAIRSSVDAITGGRNTALHFAAYKGKREAVLALLRARAR
jgi:hypothetical protein